MGEWKTYVLEEIIDKFIDYRGKTPKKTLSGVPLITAKIVKNGRLLPPNEFISKEDYLSWMTRGFPQMNDVVLTTEAPLGEVALIQDENVALAQRIITLKTNKKICDSIFLKYYLQSDEGQALLLSRASGSTVEGIKAAELKKIIVTIPNLSTQKRISSILFLIDNKISLLHHQNATLEKMAETIYRQWFIEEAKEDWKDGTLGDIIDLNYGKSLKEELRTGKGYPVVGSSGIVGYHSEYLVEGPGIVIGRKGTLGVVVYLKDNFFPIDTTYYVTPKKSSLLPYYNYCLLKSINFEELNSDSAVPGLNRNIALAWEIKIPPINKIIEFNNWSQDFFKKIESNQQQIQILTQLRDTLLPKLMSGEIKVTD